MSGHSHYATIKRQKSVNDAAKGKVFSKLARAIQMAVKAGGGGDPDTNYKLRMAVDAARSENMPKDNIERAISRASGESANIEEVMYEGFGPLGVSVIVEVATDNRNRTAQEMKNMFERGGGSLAGPGAVSFNFEQKGLILVGKGENADETTLKLIDAGAEDVEEVEDAIEVYVAPVQTAILREKLESIGMVVKSSSLIMKPKNLQTVNSKEEAEKVLGWLEKLEEHDDVQKVYANLDIPQEILKSIS